MIYSGFSMVPLFSRHSLEISIEPYSICRIRIRPLSAQTRIRILESRESSLDVDLLAKREVLNSQHGVWYCFD